MTRARVAAAVALANMILLGLGVALGRPGVTAAAAVGLLGGALYLLTRRGA